MYLLLRCMPVVCLCCFLGKSFPEQFPSRVLSWTLCRVMVPPGGKKGQ